MPLPVSALGLTGASLEGLRRRRAGDACAHQLDGDDTGRLVDGDQFDVTLVGLNGRTNRLDDFFDLFEHAVSDRGTPQVWHLSGPTPTRATAFPAPTITV